MTSNQGLVENGDVVLGESRVIRVREVEIESGGDLIDGDAIRDEQVVFDEGPDFERETRDCARVCGFEQTNPEEGGERFDDGGYELLGYMRRIEMIDEQDDTLM